MSDLESADYVYIYWIEDLDAHAKGAFSDPACYGPWKTLAEAMPHMESIKVSLMKRGDVKVIDAQLDAFLVFVSGVEYVTLGRTAVPRDVAIKKLQSVRLP